jgi:hypothetical protein
LVFWENDDEKPDPRFFHDCTMLTNSLHVSFWLLMLDESACQMIHARKEEEEEKQDVGCSFRHV